MGSVGATENKNYAGLTESQWDANNEKVASGFNDWLDSREKKAYTADQYNVFEKMTLDEVRKWLKPESASGYSYNDSDEVPEETYYYVGYDTGDVLMLDPGDSLKGVPRTGILWCVQENEATTMVYSKRGSQDISIYNDAEYKENNDIWRWDVNNAKSWRYHNGKIKR